MDYINS